MPPKKITVLIFMYLSCTDMQEIFLIKMILYNVYQSLEVYHVLVLSNAIQILKC